MEFEEQVAVMVDQMAEFDRELERYVDLLAAAHVDMVPELLRLAEDMEDEPKVEAVTAALTALGEAVSVLLGLQE